MKQVVIIGGGAAGFFTAINIAEGNPTIRVIILEQSQHVLQKVKVSGGGRCNVTHACFDPKELVAFYPRGEKELLGPFHSFMTGDTMEWFESRGIALKIEADNRVFPASNSSQTIIDCFLSSAEKAGVEILLGQNVSEIEKRTHQFVIKTKTDEYLADSLVICSGGNSKIWSLLKNMGHHIIAPVPSLFTFKIKDPILSDIPGVAVPDAAVTITDTSFESNGPLLITHWGLSGPAVLKLSSLAAFYLAGKNYQFSVNVNWVNLPFETVLNHLKEFKINSPKKKVFIKAAFENIPKRLWSNLLKASQINQDQNWSDTSNKQLEKLSATLTNSVFNSFGKSTFKEEFVTAGGIDLKEVDFKRYESKLHPNLFFAGEVLNIDGLTGGFNFQNAWTGGFIVANAVSKV